MTIILVYLIIYEYFCVMELRGSYVGATYTLEHELSRRGVSLKLIPSKS